jgi:hypothetical protein
MIPDSNSHFARALSPFLSRPCCRYSAYSRWRSSPVVTLGDLMKHALQGKIGWQV